ncbi:hypothetical protein MTBPR1_30003 [Candidatus Terasakiella magnetica]|uniref:Uncharacterized protein n=1 Tax=Candidatus Terasakiella magnetica TaxID=1867952 RepID=A0A1C3RH59_9PROT|nr:hypothetical protein [Candidatus Terasakiella magnetica]SCA56633.1 hypothetical protein MTBPR1_30003 [Candidatus Terasakiella magnetica]
MPNILKSKTYNGKSACIIKDKVPLRIQLDCLRVIKDKEISEGRRNRIASFNSDLIEFFEHKVEAQKSFENALDHASEENPIDLSDEPWIDFERVSRWGIDDKIPQWIAEIRLIKTIYTASDRGILHEPILTSENDQNESSEPSVGLHQADGFGDIELSDFDEDDFDFGGSNDDSIH